MSSKLAGVKRKSVVLTPVLKTLRQEMDYARKAYDTQKADGVAQFLSYCGLYWGILDRYGREAVESHEFPTEFLFTHPRFSQVVGPWVVSAVASNAWRIFVAFTRYGTREDHSRNMIERFRELIDEFARNSLVVVESPAIKIEWRRSICSTLRSFSCGLGHVAYSTLPSAAFSVMACTVDSTILNATAQTAAKEQVRLAVCAVLPGEQWRPILNYCLMPYLFGRSYLF
jgi:hypothetical protein